MKGEGFRLEASRRNKVWPLGLAGGGTEAG